MSETSAISGTRRQYKEMADGTIRVSIDVDPRFKRQFLELFPEIDMPVAIAPLQADFEQKEPEKPKGGHLSREAAKMCEVPEFQKFAREWYEASALKNELNTFTAEDLAVNMIYAECDIESRAELDHNPQAAKHFHELMREYRSWTVEG